MRRRFEQPSLFRKHSIALSCTMHAILLTTVFTWAWLCCRDQALSPPPCVFVELTEADEFVPPPQELAVIPRIEEPAPLLDPSPNEPDAPPPIPPKQRDNSVEPITPPRFDLVCQDRKPRLSDWLLRVRPPKPVITVTAPPQPAPPAVVVIAPIEGQNPPPKYPARAIRLGLEGTVCLRTGVDAAGFVTSCVVESSSGSRLLDRAAVAAVLTWRFTAGPGTVSLPVRFSLSERLAGGVRQVRARLEPLAKSRRDPA